MAEPGVPTAPAPNGALTVSSSNDALTEPSLNGGPAADPLDPLTGGESTRNSIWPAIYPELLKLVREHNSTIIFVNNRRSAERVALRLNELAAREEDAAHSPPAGHALTTRLPPHNSPPRDSPSHDIARAHHGSLAREERTKVEELLKAGELPCLVATSSLELGIDMGAVNLVLQIESPKSVARGLQRIGRAGHGVGEVSRGRIFPKFRGDLLECAVVARRMHEGMIEPTVVPRNALDVLAQQIVAIAVSAEPTAATAAASDAPDGASEDAGVSVEDLYALVTSTHSYAELSRELLENVLDMLDGRYPSQEFGELRARIVWDRVAGTIRARKGSRQLAIANAGTIPDRGLYAVTLPDGRRVGELDEEMVYEARPGQAFLLGASTWRIEEIGRDRVIVTPAPGAPGAVPFWKGDSVGRPKELGEAIGAFSRWAVEQEPQTLERDYDLDPRAARNLIAYLREQQAATRVLPSERTIVVERFRDEIGDWRLCILSPYGGRVHAAWALALSARIRERFDLEADAISSDDGIVLHLPDLDADDLESLPSATELVLIEPEELEQVLTAELGGSALFGARFRENAGRALLIPRAYPGRRTPLWQQRLKSQNLLEVAKRYADFPIILETYRECLRDVLDVPGLQELLRALHTREISLVEVETPTASPFASSLLFDYVATYMYEGDTPNAERRAAALSLDRDLLRELLGQEELRELIDPGALERVEQDLQCRSEITRATSRDGLHDVLRRVGDLTAEEVAERVFDGVDHVGMLGELERERRAIRLRVGGEERYVAADEAGLYRDALGAVPPGGLPEAFLEDVPDALRVLVARFARTHGPFRTDELHARYRLDASSVLRELERADQLVRGELRPGGSEREWCDVEVLRRLRRASLAALRKEIEPADQRALAAFLPSWQGVDRHSGAGAGVDRLREVLVPLQGLALPCGDLGARCAAAADRRLLPDVARQSLRERRGRVGRRGLDRAQLGTGGAVLPRGCATDRGASAPRSGAAASSPPSAREHELLRERLARGPAFFTDLLAELDIAGETLREALWDLVWAGEATNDAWAPLRAPHLTLARGGRAARGGESPLAGSGAATGSTAGRSMTRPLPFRHPQKRRAGAGSRPLVADRIAVRRAGVFLAAPLVSPRPSTAARSPSCCSSATGSSPASRSSPRGSAVASRCYTTRLRNWRLWVYAAGVTSSRGWAAHSSHCQARLSVCALADLRPIDRAQAADTPGRADDRGGPRIRTLVLAAADPAQPYGAALPWPRRTTGARHRPSAARVAGAYVVMVEDEPLLYVERGGRGLVTLAEAPLGEALLRPSRRRCAPGVSASSPWSESTASRRSPRLSPRS